MGAEGDLPVLSYGVGIALLLKIGAFVHQYQIPLFDVREIVPVGANIKGKLAAVPACVYHRAVCHHLSAVILNGDLCYVPRVIAVFCRALVSHEPALGYTQSLGYGCKLVRLRGKPPCQI